MAKIGAGFGQKVKEKDKEKKPGSIVDSLLNNKKNEKSGSFFNNKKETERSGLFFGKQEENNTASQPNDAFQAAIQKLMGGVNNGFTSAGIRKPTIAMPQQTQPIMPQQPAMSSGAENYARRLMQLSAGSGAEGVAMPAGVKPVGTEVQQPQKAGLDFASKVAQRQVQTPERNILATAEPAQVQEPEKVKKGYDYAQKMMQQGGNDQTGKVGKVNPVVSSVMAKTGPNMEENRQEKLQQALDNNQEIVNSYGDQNEWRSRMRKASQNTLDYRTYYDTIGEGVKYGAWDERGENSLKSNERLQQEINDLNSQLEYQGTIDYSDEGIEYRENRIKKLKGIQGHWNNLINNGYSAIDENAFPRNEYGAIMDTRLTGPGSHMKPLDYNSDTIKQYKDGSNVSAAEYYDYMIYDYTHADSVEDLKKNYRNLQLQLAADPENKELQKAFKEAENKLNRVRTEASEIWAAMYTGGNWINYKAGIEIEKAMKEADELSQQLDQNLPGRLENQKALRENMLKFREILNDKNNIRKFDPKKLPYREPGDSKKKDELYSYGTLA